MSITFGNQATNQQPLIDSQGMNIDLSSASPQMVQQFQQLSTPLLGSYGGGLKNVNGKIYFVVPAATIYLLKGQGDNDARYNQLMATANQAQQLADKSGIGYQIGNYKVEERGATESQQLASANINSINGQSAGVATNTVNTAQQNTTTRAYQVGDPSPNTGAPITQLQADILNKQGVRYNPTTGAISSQTTNASNTSSSINGGNVSNTGNAGTVNNQSALDIINKSGLDEGTKALFREVINQWDPNNEVNIQNVMGTFENIKKNTISPYFQEQANIFIDEVKRAGDYLSGERQRELETEGISAKRNIENAQKNLESRGMTFSGESEKALGEKGAYGTGKTIPARFGGMEGEVNAQNRLMASSSSARYSKSLQDLSRQAEQNLGTVKAQGLVPGVNMLGGVTGSLTRQEKQAEGDALSNIYQQETINREARNPLEVIK